MNPAPGRRLFIAACVFVLLLGGVHLFAVYYGNFVTPTDPREIDVDRALRAATVDVGPFHTNDYNLVQLLSASLSILALALGTVNLIALPAVIAHGRLRALTIANIVYVGLFLIATLIYRFPPPMVFALIATMLFIAALVMQRGKPLAA